MSKARAIGAAIIACASLAHAADDPALLSRLLNVARAERIAYRLAYLQHCRYAIPDLGTTVKSRAAALRLPEEDLADHRIEVTEQGRHWRVAGGEIVIVDGVVKQSPFSELRKRTGAMDTFRASQLAHARIDEALDAPLAQMIDSPQLAVGVIEYLQQMMRILNLDTALDAFRVDETKATMRRLANRIEQYSKAHAQSIPTYAALLSEPSRLNRWLYAKDEWRGDLRIDVSPGHYTIISGGSDRHFEPTTWTQPLRAADPREDLVLTDGQFVRAADLADYFNQVLKEADEAKAAPTAHLPPYRVGGDVHAPQVIEKVEPPIPPDALRAHVSGIMIIEVVIDEKGNVTQTRILKGLHPSFDDSALTAIKKWRFRPATLNGKPVAVYYTLTVVPQVK